MSKKYMQKNKKLIKANALGDDRNLAENGMSSHYWYSVGDGFRLVLWLRQQYLNYDNIPVANIGEEYVAFRENNSRILVTDPYYSNNFAQYLIDDITRITATGNFSGLITPWTQMPTTIIIPLLSGLHWRTIKIDIDYENRTADILFDDPYGQGRFPENLKSTIYPIIKSNIEKLIKIQIQDDSFNLISEIPTYEKAHDQQGHGENSWDCGPIAFSNIEDYIKVSVNITEQLIYSIPTYIDLQHSTEIAEIRINDIKRYSEIAQLPIDPIRLNKIKQQLEGARETQVQKMQELVPEVKITELNPFYISMLFEILENKRLFEGKDTTKEYTKEELGYAYQVVLSETLTDKDLAFSPSILNNKKEPTNMKEQSNEEKLEKDLTKLIEANSLIGQSISALENPSLDTTAFLGYLEQIGQLIHDISWKEDNHNCIRNKHGYRNRHKDEGNNKNKKGAKLDFETLGHLKDLSVDEDFQYLLTTDLEKTKSSLQVLQTKVNFIISKEHSHLSQEQQSQITYTKEDSHDEDVGFLRQASAYYHDTRCINKLIELL